ncbi:hypothetical protein [Nocardia aurantia]|uniref:Uncharacterized protein n=1 Tax=Nocardia aurantia TaxID=2585199 RepID=A0A7K0DTZ4_9NOCA|nr:hypothetical protein [Nocardia aurantia]MQY29230.1 hypothetical protein [Nocardia aurantia]
MFANRARGAVLAMAVVAGALAGTTAVQAGNTVGRADPVAALPAASGTYDHRWQGHDRAMSLYYDGLGTITLYDGAVDSEQWNLTWVRDDDTSVLITLRDRTAITGNGLGGALGTGTYWRAGLVTAPDNQVTVLHFTRGTQAMSDPDAGYFWCAPDTYGNSALCGA